MLRGMRKVTLVTFLALSSVGTAGAADLSATVWKYIQGKVQQKPEVDDQQFGMVMRTWDAAAGLQTGHAAFMYFPEQGTDCWMFILYAPKLKTADYLGTSWLQPLGRAGKNGVLNVSLIGGGTFKGLLAMEGILVGKDGRRDRILALLTRPFAATDPATAAYSR